LPFWVNYVRQYAPSGHKNGKNGVFCDVLGLQGGGGEGGEDGVRDVGA